MVVLVVMTGEWCVVRDDGAGDGDW